MCDESPKSVILKGPGDPVIVCGKEKPPLTSAQYEVVKVLLSAGSKGLTLTRLGRDSHHCYANRILKRLRSSDPDWLKVIQMPGRPWGRYRIASRCPEQD